MLRIRTYLPREGTETTLSKNLRDALNMYKNLSTSRGDGNDSIFCTRLFFILYKNLSTSREDGNGIPLNCHKFLDKGIRTYLPREGTETRVTQYLFA